MADHFTGLTNESGPGGQPDGRYEGGVMPRGSKDPQMPGGGQPYTWTCPGCGTKHVTDFAAGCHVCNERNARIAMQQQPQGPVSEEVLRIKVLRHPTSQHAAGSIRAGGLTPKARRTLYLALQMFAEAKPADDTLPKAETLAWARLLAEAEAQEDSQQRGDTK